MKMRGCSIAGIYCCDAPSTGEIWTIAPSVSKMQMGSGRPTVSAAWVHARRFACASNGFSRIGGLFSLLVVLIRLSAWSSSGWPWSKYSISTSSCSYLSLITNTGGSSLSLVFWYFISNDLIVHQTLCA